MGNNYCCIDKEKDTFRDDYLATLIRADNIRIRNEEDMPKMLRPTRGRRNTDNKPKQKQATLLEDRRFTISPMPVKNIFDDESLWKQTREERENV